jgi:sensor histidine kinase regulating citrate/malate metabolism
MTSFEIDSTIDFLPEIIGERIVWVQILYNLLKNAAESVLSNEGSWGYIYVTGAIENTAETEMIHLKIEDNGRGIDNECLESIFDEGFSQKDAAHLGIGLHWCRKVMLEMNGQLYAESKGIGRGARFHLNFPMSVNYSGEHN